MSVIESRRSAAGVTHVTLNRADKANALNDEMVAGLQAAIDACAEDGTRLLVLGAEGRHFCAGFDLSDLDDCSDGDLLLRFVRIETVLQTLYHAPFPPSPLRRAARWARARTCSPPAADGSHRQNDVPDAGPGLRYPARHRRLVARIGTDAARTIQTETRSFDAAEAQALGFATEISEPDDWPAIEEAAAKAATTLTPEATTALFQATVTDTRATDMADLVASAGRPGLRQRIQEYRDALKR